MPDPMKVLVPPGWTPETVVAVAGPVPIGDILHGLAEYEADECPDCGFALADDLSGRLERTPRAASQPCDSCLWAHGPFEFERTTADEVA